MVSLGTTQTGNHGTEYCGASAKARLRFIREFWRLVLLVIFLLVLERVRRSAAFMDVLRCSCLSLINLKPSALVQQPVAGLDVSDRRSWCALTSRSRTDAESLYLFGCVSTPPLEVEMNIGCSIQRWAHDYEAQHTHVCYRFFEDINIHLYISSIGIKMSKILKRQWCRSPRCLG